MKEQNGNGLAPSIAQAIEEIKALHGDSFSLERINLAELERRTGVSCIRLKRNSFQDLPSSTKGVNMRAPSSAVIPACWTVC